MTNLHESAEFVRWSPDGAHYAVGLGRRIDLYSVATAAVVVKVIMLKASSIYRVTKKNGKNLLLN